VLAPALPLVARLQVEAREPRTKGVFKLTMDRERRDGVTLRLEGRLAAAWVDEFARAVRAAMSGDVPVTLDLDGLSFADARGVAVIRNAVDRGVRLSGGSQFIGALIDGERSQ
jgi:anti-anti-sigma regulatory factor